MILNNMGLRSKGVVEKHPREQRKMQGTMVRWGWGWAKKNTRARNVCLGRKPLPRVGWVGGFVFLGGGNPPREEVGVDVKEREE